MYSTKVTVVLILIFLIFYLNQFFCSFNDCHSKWLVFACSDEHLKLALIMNWSMLWNYSSSNIFDYMQDYILGSLGFHVFLSLSEFVTFHWGHMSQAHSVSPSFTQFF